MKGFEKFILIVFSLIIIIISITLVLVSTQMLELKGIYNIIDNVLVSNKILFLVLGTIFALFGLVGLFSTSDSEEAQRGGLAIKQDTGTVYITRDTFESIIATVTRGYAELRNVRVDMQVTETGIVVNIYTMILPDTVVPTLTSKLQENVKSSVLKQTTVEIKEVNVKIKGVYQEPSKK